MSLEDNMAVYLHRLESPLGGKRSALSSDQTKIYIDVYERKEYLYEYVRL
jgi:hypothetical protein